MSKPVCYTVLLYTFRYLFKSSDLVLLVFSIDKNLENLGQPRNKAARGRLSRFFPSHDVMCTVHFLGGLQHRGTLSRARSRARSVLP